MITQATDGAGVGAMHLTRARVLRGAVWAAAGFSAAAALQACATGSTAGGTTPAKSNKPVKLTFEWPTYTDPKRAWAEGAIKLYTQKYPNVTIDPMWNTNPTEKLTTALAGGQPPDVGWFGSGHWQFFQAFKPVETLMAQRKMKVEDYFPTIVDAMKWRGKMLAFPMGINTSAMFVSKPVYQKAGVPLPADDQTWDDIIANGKRLTSGDGAQKVWGNEVAFYTSTWPAAYGGKWIDSDGTKVLINSPQTLKVLQILRDSWEKYGISPNPKEIADMGSSPYLQAFTSGRVAQYAGGTWGLPPFRAESFDWDIVEVPSLVDGGKKIKGAFCGTEEIFVIAGQPNEDAAADFAGWMCGPEQLTFAGNRGDIIPAIQKVAKDAFVTNAQEPRPKNLQAFVRAADYAPPIAPHPISGDLQKAYNTALGKFLGSSSDLTAQLTAQQALDQAQHDMQLLLDDWNKQHPK